MHQNVDMNAQKSGKNKIWSLQFRQPRLVSSMNCARSSQEDIERSFKGLLAEFDGPGRLCPLVFAFL